MRQYLIFIPCKIKDFFQSISVAYLCFNNMRPKFRKCPIPTEAIQMEIIHPVKVSLPIGIRLGGSLTVEICILR